MKKSTYINIWDYKNPKYPFQFFIGGRGTGKTFSALRGLIQGECKGKFIYMRRKADQLDYICDNDKRGEGANPFKPINNMYDCNYGFTQIQRGLKGVYHRTQKDGKFLYEGAPIGYGVSLVQVASVRGLDFSDCTDLIYDEFIKEKHEKKITGESDAFLNAYETFNRNREFDGGEPLYCWCLANSNDIYNPLFEGLGLVNEVEKMIRSGKHDRYIESRGIAIHLLESSEEFVEKKSQTALYKMTSGTRFADMALSNDFAYDDFSLVEQRPLTGYTPMCSYGPATLYRKKGTKEIYVSYSPARCIHYNNQIQQDRKAFYVKFGCALNEYYMSSRIIFESYELKQIILDNIL